MTGTFPFGRPVQRVAQVDRGPKRVFVLGVYASAVHARWVDDDDVTLVGALAVSSEPEIFWRGDGADAIIAQVTVPAGAGRLEPAAANLNGTTGVALDELFLAPLGLERADAWLCDLVPYSCKNRRQATALKCSYDRLVANGDVPAYDWPPVPEVLADKERRAQIEAELAEASPDVVITLGDDPLRWFTRYFRSEERLAKYGETPDTYGVFHEIVVHGRAMILLPLAHPLQVARVGSYSATWGELHEYWTQYTAPDLLLEYTD